MVTGLSIINDNNQNKSMHENADQDINMMEVDGQADNTNVELNETLDHSVGEENDVDVTIEKIREYCFRATNTADEDDAGDMVDTVIILDTLETADTAYTDETPETAEQSDFMSCVIDDYLESEGYKPILQLTREQLIILDWLASGNLLNNDLDE